MTKTGVYQDEDKTITVPRPSRKSRHGTVTGRRLFFKLRQVTMIEVFCPIRRIMWTNKPD